MRPFPLAVIALSVAVLLVSCASGDDRAEPAAPPSGTTGQVTVTTELDDNVQATWKAPRTCQEVAELRDFLATAGPGALNDLMRRGTEDAAADLGCDKP